MKNKTVTCKVMDAVKYWNGDKYVCGKHKKHHTHIVNAVGTDRLYGAYASDIGGDSAVCTISEYNQLIHSCSTNSEESSLKHLEIWQEGIKRQPETDGQHTDKLNEMDKELKLMEKVKPIEYVDFGAFRTENYSFTNDATKPTSQPVFTQAMTDNGELPKAGMLCLINFPDIDNAWYEYTIDFIGKHMVVATCKEVAERTGHIDNVYFKPIDTRTNKEKAVDDIRLSCGFNKINAMESELLSKAYDKWVGE